MSQPSDSMSLPSNHAAITPESDDPFMHSQLISRHSPSFTSPTTNSEQLSVDSHEQSRTSVDDSSRMIHSYSFPIEFAEHQSAIKEGNMDKAIQSFIMLQTHSSQNEVFSKYLLELVDHIDPGRDSDLSRFFGSLPALIQSTIIENATAYLEERDRLKAFQVLFDYIQGYPRHAYKYLIRAIDLLIVCIQSVNPKDARPGENCFRVLVTELLPRLWKQRILLSRRDRVPTVKSTDSKHYIVLSYSLFEQYLLLGQQYYISQRSWSELTKFTCAMLGCCGYEGLARLDFLSHTNRFQYMKEHREKLRLDIEDDHNASTSIGGSDDSAEDLKVLVAFMCEFMAASAQFVHFGYNYYRAVCALDDDFNDEKSCLIPVCAIQPTFSKHDSESGSASGSNRDKRAHGTAPKNGDSDDVADSTGISDSHTVGRKRLAVEAEMEQADGRLSAQTQNEIRNVSQLVNETRHSKKLKLDNIPDRGEGLDSYCMRGVDDALQILSKAADCMRHLVDLWQWGSITSPRTNWSNVFGGWEQELCRIIEEYKLPFDIYNAVLLVRSDLALSSPSVSGNLAKALKLSQKICDRIELQRRTEKRQCENGVAEYDIPFMFAFRVLYNIGVIYLLVGSVQQSTLEIAIILSVFPIPDGLSEKDFLVDEIDCHTVASVFQGHKFGMMRVTQEGLVVRCIKHLIVSLDSESEQKGGMASIDSAMRWDEKAGNMIVLMQYGWPYWCTRTKFWQKITQKLRERRVFKNRNFLEYVYVADILQTIQALHESDTVVMDIIPPEFAMRNSYRHITSGYGNTATSSPSSPQLSSVSSPGPSTSSYTGSTDQQSTANDGSRRLPPLGSLILGTSGGSSSLNPPLSQPPPPPPPPPIYQPSFTNTILPSMSMSPTWYSASAQKNAHANWMSPSFYYSRPATSVMLPKREAGVNLSGDSNDQQSQSSGASDVLTPEQMQRSFVPKHIVTLCLENRRMRYSPKITPQRMRHVLQKFLKNMVLKANDEI